MTEAAEGIIVNMQLNISAFNVKFKDFNEILYMIYNISKHFSCFLEWMPDK